MEPLLQTEGEEGNGASKLPQQAAAFFLHTAIALISWAVLMGAGYALNLPQVAQSLILLLCIVFPLFSGYLVNHFRQDEIAQSIWLLGLIWFLIIALWILDMPTGPNECYQCDATDKIVRTFFSLPSPSGLIDNDGPFLATWPAAAMLGYSIGAKLSLRRKAE
jgi:hypothetical protein